MKKGLICSLALLAALGLQSCNIEEIKYGTHSEAGDEAYGYVAKVWVTVQGDTIVKVEFADDSNHVTNPTYWNGATVWTEQEEAYLKSFEGKTVKEVLAMKAEEDFVAGASVTSKRVLTAIQKALNS